MLNLREGGIAALCESRNIFHKSDFWQEILYYVQHRAYGVCANILHSFSAVRGPLCCSREGLAWWRAREYVKLSRFKSEVLRQEIGC
jgi:hypothetical protein